MLMGYPGYLSLTLLFLAIRVMTLSSTWHSLRTFQLHSRISHKLLALTQYSVSSVFVCKTDSLIQFQTYSSRSGGGERASVLKETASCWVVKY
jgi:hypothetical protein